MFFCFTAETLPNLLIFASELGLKLRPRVRIQPVRVCPPSPRPCYKNERREMGVGGHHQSMAIRFRQSWVHTHSSPYCPWANFLTFLNLIFLIC